MSQSSSKDSAWPHPANFRVGSVESRAAARAMIQSCDAAVTRNQFVIIREPVDSKTTHADDPNIGPWIPQSDGSFFRVLRFSTEPDEETKRRLLAR